MAVRKESIANSVELRGRISKVERLRYLPSGEAVLELLLEVKQEQATRVGAVPVLCLGPVAEGLSGTLRIGKEISVRGELWSREFRTPRGKRNFEMKVLVRRIDETK